MKSEQRSLLAIVLSVGVLVLWYMFFAPKQPEQPVKEPSAVEATDAEPAHEREKRTGFVAR